MSVFSSLCDSALSGLLTISCVLYKGIRFFNKVTKIPILRLLSPHNAKLLFKLIHRASVLNTNLDKNGTTLDVQINKTCSS